MSLGRGRSNTGILIKLVLAHTCFGDTHGCHGLCHVDCRLAANTRAICSIGSGSLGWRVDDSQRFGLGRVNDGGLLGLLIVAIGSRSLDLGLAWSLGLD